VATVQVYVSRLRKVLGAETLMTRPPGYLLEVGPEQVDILRFERLVADARRADPDRASDLLHAALGLWRGPALAEFASEPFARVEGGRLEERRLAAFEERIEADLACRRHAELIGELEVLIAEHPHRERLRRQLMLALYRSERQAEAARRIPAGARRARRARTRAERRTAPSRAVDLDARRGADESRRDRGDARTAEPPGAAPSGAVRRS
jgi:DNA-binding SARP family transcriptional activator